jgi:hypothetical protein
LPEDVRPEFEKWLEEQDQGVFTLMDDLMGEGMKVGLSLDRLNSCAVVTFTGGIRGEHRVRYVMTTRAATWWQALALSVWKHVVYLDGDWGNYLPRTSQSSVWG